MSRAVPVLYLAILAIFVAAGSLLTARSDPATTTAALPEGCTDVPSEVVEELFPGTEANFRTATEEEARYGRWVDADGAILIELRCTRFRFSEFGPYRDALAAAEAGRASLVDTEPPAILAEVPDGVTIRQLDESSGVLRTWFVRSPLTTDEAEDVVTRTRRARSAPDGGDPT